MKKSFLLFVALFVFAGFGQAQEGMKAVKKAARSLVTYNLDNAKNKEKLTEAVTLIDKAFESDEVASMAKAYQVKADIYSTSASSIVNESIISSSEAVKDKDLSVGVKAVAAYAKAYELAEKKFEKKDAITGMKSLQNIIENVAIVSYQNKNWKTAYDAFQATISLSNFLTDAGEESIVTPEKIKDLMINSVSVGAQENSGIEMGPIIEKSIKMDIQDPSLYQIAYSTFADTDKEKALMYLNKGVELFPDDSGLLFAQINYYIGEGKLEALIDKLKAAIAKEPDNASVSATLGNVYDQLYSKTADEGDEAKAEEYFNGALDYYTQATEKDPNSFSSFYGIGALYFNKAAKYGKQLNELGSDYSAEGIKKYDGIKAKMSELYDQSLPFLEKAEAINPKDGLVLQALREYYARTGNLDKSNEYKARIDALEGGE